MASKKKREDKEPEQFKEPELVEEIEPKPITHELAVISAANERGLNSTKYDHVDVKFLFGDNYRINCYKNHKIAISHFISFSVKEGIYYCTPEINDENESKVKLH